MLTAYQNFVRITTVFVKWNPTSISIDKLLLKIPCFLQVIYYTSNAIQYFVFILHYLTSCPQNDLQEYKNKHNYYMLYKTEHLFT